MPASSVRWFWLLATSASGRASGYRARTVIEDEVGLVEEVLAGGVHLDLDELGSWVSR